MKQGWSKRGSISSGCKWTQHVPVQCARNFSTANSSRVSRQDSERVFRAGCWGQYLELRMWKLQEGGRNYLKKNFIIPTVYRIILLTYSKSRVLLKKPTRFQLVKKFTNSPHLMKLEGSLPHSQVPSPVPIPSQLDPGRTPTSYFLKIHILCLGRTEI